MLYHMRDKKKFFYLFLLLDIEFFQQCFIDPHLSHFITFQLSLCCPLLRFAIFYYTFGIIKLFFNMIADLDISFSGFLFYTTNYLRCEKEPNFIPMFTPGFWLCPWFFCVVFCLFSSCVACVQCFQYIFIVHIFSPTFIYIINIEVLTSVH